MEPKTNQLLPAAVVAIVVLVSLALGVAVAVIRAPDLLPTHPRLDKPLPVAESPKPVVTDWLPTSEARTYLGLRDDGSVIWRRTKRAGSIGDLPPVGSSPPVGQTAPPP